MNPHHYDDVVRAAIVVLTAASVSGLFATIFTRRHLRERDRALQALLIDSEKIDYHSVALQSLRYELEAAKVEMENRRLVLVAQEETIRKQRQELLEAQRMLIDHEATITQLSRWAEWVTRILAEKGIEAPPLPVSLPVTPLPGTPKE